MHQLFLLNVCRPAQQLCICLSGYMTTIVKNFSGKTPREVELMPVHAYCTWKMLMPILRQKAGIDTEQELIVGMVIDDRGIAIKVAAVPCSSKKKC
jgi:hypothetical protein